MTTTTTKLSEHDLAAQLESIIDSNGVYHTLSVLSYICGEKAEHAAVHWQDTSRAKIWMYLAMKIDILTARAEKERL